MSCCLSVILKFPNPPPYCKHKHLISDFSGSASLQNYNGISNESEENTFYWKSCSMTMSILNKKGHNSLAHQNLARNLMRRSCQAARRLSVVAELPFVWCRCSPCRRCSSANLYPQSIQSLSWWWELERHADFTLIHIIAIFTTYYW